MRDQPYRPSAHLPGRRRDRDTFVGELHAAQLKDSFGDHELVPLSPYLGQLLGQLFIEFVEFRTACGDSFNGSGSSVPGW
ncbi:hypothetical protein ACFV8E_10345 [Streptomyces sp. NPDC059849]|uniref:hypothetical protein n=1 Tax=unclassified Streptomyces TaxID=2593676 RepID=UPI003664981A